MKHFPLQEIQKIHFCQGGIFSKSLMSSNTKEDKGEEGFKRFIKSELDRQKERYLFDNYYFLPRKRHHLTKLNVATDHKKDRSIDSWEANSPIMLKSSYPGNASISMITKEEIKVEDHANTKHNSDANQSMTIAYEKPY